MSRTSKTTPKDPEQPTLEELDQTFAFVCRNFLGFEDDSPPNLALWENYILDFTTLMAYNEEDLKQLTYTPVGTTTPLPLMKAYSLKLKWLRDWNFHLVSEYRYHVLTEEWRDIDKGEYGVFLMRIRTGRITLAPNRLHQHPKQSILLPSSRKASSKMHPCTRS